MPRLQRERKERKKKEGKLFGLWPFFRIQSTCSCWVETRRTRVQPSGNKRRPRRRTAKKKSLSLSISFFLFLFCLCVYSCRWRGGKEREKSKRNCIADTWSHVVVDVDGPYRSCNCNPLSFYQQYKSSAPAADSNRATINKSKSRARPITEKERGGKAAFTRMRVTILFKRLRKLFQKFYFIK